MLTAEPEQFAAAITEIDRALKERAASILRTRERIAQLRAGDRLFVSSEVADYLEQLHRLGVSQRGIDGERDGWILAQAISPLHAVAWIHDKRDAIADPEFQTLYLQYDDAFGWPPDDPRLEGLANRAHNWSTNRHSTGTSANVSAIDPAIANLVATSAGAASPAWDRLTELARKRKGPELRPAARCTTASSTCVS